MSQPKRRYLRFSLAQRIEHWILFASFTLLAITGLPQKFVGLAWAESMIAAFGGIEQTRLIHRWSAIVLIALSVYHVLVVAYKLYVQRVEWSLLPRIQDARDLLGVLFYNFGLKKERPKMPRYNYAEKMEYWAVLWGTVLMAVTGFMLWNPIATARFLPGSFIPAAKAAHGGEALLAVMAIIVWHLYWVHLRRFNPSMFTGSLSAEEMAHEHGLELEQIETGALPPMVPAGEQARHVRVFWPVATVVALAMVFGLYWFATLEDTAPAVAAEEAPRPAFQPIRLPAGGMLHATLQEYTGPETCAECHAEASQTAAASAHNQRVAAAGPNPWLAKLVEAGASAGEATPHCLVCHAKDWQPNDLLASAQSVGAAGGETCTRCHTGYLENDVHTEVGLTCVSCHTATSHQIQTEVSCTTCHAEQPHPDPLLNVKHSRLDCRTCHVRESVALNIDASQPRRNPLTNFFEPTVSRVESDPQFGWYTSDGQAASPDTDGAVIAPLVPATVYGPADLNPATFALDGKASSATEEITANMIASHGIFGDGARTCDSCHGPESDFDFVSLGYEAEQADKLSARPVEKTE
jgi:cytochrome b subunit of formate dehydrogenase